MSSTELKKRKRDDDLGIPKLSGVNYEAVVDREIVDKRFERERSTNSSEIGKPAAVSSTFDAFQRMAAGLEGRTLAEKIADPNRPTWEQYKKENENKLDLVGTDVKQMVEYRAELDRERERLLKARRSRAINEESDEDDEKSIESSDNSSKHRKKSKKRKKEKKSKKSKKKNKKESKSKRKSSESENSSDESR